MLSVEPSSSDRELPKPDGANMEEPELVRRAQLGSSAAFEQLVVSRGPQLYRYLWVRLRNESDARDAFQETLAAAWQGLPSLKSRDRFWPWVVGIAAHKAADAARERIRTSDHQSEELGSEDDHLLEVRDAMDALPGQFREVLLLRYFLQLSEEEAAAALGVRVGTVKSRSARARKALMELMQ